MKCSELRKALEQKAPEAALGAEQRRHLQNCELCTQYLSDLNLRKRLATYPVPEVNPAFLQSAIARALASEQQDVPRATRYKLEWVFGLAASLVLALTLVLLRQDISDQLIGSGGRATAQLATNVSSHVSSNVSSVAETSSVNVTERQIRVMIYSKVDQPDAEIAIELPEGVELRGFAGRQTLRWHTHLRKGGNLLSLPLRLSGPGGEVRVSSFFGDKLHQVNVAVDSQSASPDTVSPPSPVEARNPPARQPQQLGSTECRGMDCGTLRTQV